MEIRSSSSGGALRGVGESLIFKRREREEHLASYGDCVRGMRKMHMRAEWEHLLVGKGEHARVQQTFDGLKNQRKEQLHARRRRLAELYNREWEHWKQACLANVETPEDRKQKMVQRALELRAQRERERMAIVEEKRMQQYRASCDDLRVEDSRKIQQTMLEERAQQLAERRRLQQQVDAYEAKMTELWEEDRLKKEERERQDRERAIARDAEVQSILDLQVDLVRKRKQEEAAKKVAAEQQILNEWRKLKELEEEMERQNRLDEAERAKEIKRTNEERSDVVRAAADREREYDRRLLQLALAQEATAKQFEQEQQERFKQEQLEYQQILKKQMEVEAEDTQELDRMRKQVEDEVWAKEDAQHAAEEAARQELLRQVLISREHQIESKKSTKQQQRVEDVNYLQQIKHETEEALQKELRQQEERRMEIKRAQSDLLRQQQERQQSEEERKQSEYLELKRMQLAEKQHKERIAQFATELPVVNHRRKTAQWYFDA